MRTQTVPCHYCRTPTTMLGTKLCNRCWELRSRIIEDLPLVRRIMHEVVVKERQMRTRTRRA